jgi:WD40 repeat protein
MRRLRWWIGAVLCVVMATGAMAREPHRPHRPHKPRAPRPPRTPDGQPDAPSSPANVHFADDGSIALPGRGLALAWSPDGSRLAVGGRFRDPATGLRYDTRIADAAAKSLEKSFACHYFFVVSTAWTANPFLGDVVASGGGDHAVKLWDAAGQGSVTCKPGQFQAADGGIRALGEINGWTLGLAFSPDGRFLAGASRDRMIRVWSLEPGPNQFRVVGVLYDKDAGNFASVAWQSDGRGLVTGDRRGHVKAWDFDPDVDGFDAATIAKFATLSYEAQPGWCQDNAALAVRTPRWSDQRSGWIWNVRVAPDGTRTAAAGNDGALVIYDLASGGVLANVGTASGTALHGLDWSPDGALVAAGGADHAIHVFDAATGAAYDRLEGHGDIVSAVAWSPDGRALASTAGGPRVSLALLNVTTGPDLAIRLWTTR